MTFTALDDVVASHRAIRRFFAAAEGASEGALVAWLDWLAAGLPRHFALEEQPGGFFDAVGRRGDGRAIVAGLREEHRALERALAEIVAARTRGEPLGARMRSLARELAAHEAREARLGLEIEDLALPRR